MTDSRAFECPCGDTHMSALAAVYCEAQIEADDRTTRHAMSRPPRDHRPERYYLSEN